MTVEVTQADRDAAANILGDAAIRFGDLDTHHLVQAFAAHRRAALEDAALVCEQQAQDFLSPEYATNQPISSMLERFACKECAEAIRALTQPKDLP